jgi:hypothetical protein
MWNTLVEKFKSSAAIHRLLLWVIVLALVAGCASRYRLDLFITEDASRRRVNVQETQYVRGSVLADPNAEDKLRPGAGNAIVLIFSTRGQGKNRPDYSVLTYDELMTFRVYIQLLENPRPSTVPLKGNCFAHLLGRYEQSPEDKIFLADSGAVVIDSVTSKRLFGAIQGEFKNPKGAPISLDGKFSVKTAR